jgi:hypothetical protein
VVLLSLGWLPLASGVGPEGATTRSEPTSAAGPQQSSPLRIRDASAQIVKAEVTGPTFHSPEHFQGFEEFYHPRLKRLRDEYELEKVVAGESNEFCRLLRLRHWVHSRWPIDNDQTFSGDAFAILEKAKSGCGFHCAHSMTVQQAVLSAMGYVARNVLVDRDHRDLDKSAHHGVNEVWSNDHAQWVLLDAKYDIHFERDGVPLSALELHEAVRGTGVEASSRSRGSSAGRFPTTGNSCTTGRSAATGGCATRCSRSRLRTPTGPARSGCSCTTTLLFATPRGTATTATVLCHTGPTPRTPLSAPPTATGSNGLLASPPCGCGRS